VNCAYHRRGAEDVIDRVATHVQEIMHNHSGTNAYSIDRKS